MAREYIVYLAGPMTGITVKEAKAWRNYFTEQMPEYIKTRSPIITELENLSDESVIQSEHPNMLMGGGDAFVEMDLQDVRTADLIVFNYLGAKKISQGTLGEFHTAATLEKRRITIIEKEGNLHEHPFLRKRAGVIVETVTESVFATLRMLLPDDLLIKELKKRARGLK